MQNLLVTGRLEWTYEEQRKYNIEINVDTDGKFVIMLLGTSFYMTRIKRFKKKRL